MQSGTWVGSAHHSFMVWNMLTVMSYSVRSGDGCASPWSGECGDVPCR